jgi:Tol biopolymer transport system component
MKRQRQPYLTVLIFLGTFLTLTYGLTVLAYSPQRTDQIITNLERVSVNSLGEEGNNESSRPVVSGDGRYVVFSSLATNLVPTDTNVFLGWDIFVHDREIGETTLVSVSSTSEQGNAPSTTPDVSADGRYVVFDSLATNLVVSDTNNIDDVFLYDRQTKTTVRVSVSSTGEQGNNYSHSPTISADGRYIVFTSNANNLVPDDTNNQPDIFVHDRVLGTTERVSINSQGEEGDYSSHSGRLSADGRYVVFTSYANNLVPGDTNSEQDVFVHDRLNRQTNRISISSLGVQGNADSLNGDISASGRYVVFTSVATNLVTIPLNSSMNVFLHDRSTGQTVLISQNTMGIAGNHWSGFARLSGDEQFIIFHSQASNLVTGDNNGFNDVFVFERSTGYLVRVNTTPGGDQGNGNSGQGASDDTGRIVVFESEANNLVLNDSNNRPDIFVGEWQLFHIFLPAIFR